MLPFQVVDYAAWQREHLEGEVLEAELAWWKKTLDGAPPLLELPWEKPRPDVATTGGIAVPVQLGAEAVEALRQLVAAEHTTLFVVLLSAIQVCSLVVRETAAHPSPALYASLKELQMNLCKQH